MKRLILYAFASVIIFCGCAIFDQPSFQEIREEYHHSSLQVPHIFLIDVETSSVNHFPQSLWSYTDSITKMFVNELNNLDITIEFDDSIINRWSDSVWTKKPKNYHNLPYRRLNKNYILNTAPLSDKPQLIPVLVYRHVFRTEPGARRHFASIDLWVFIVENGELTYSKRVYRTTDGIFYIYRHELDKSQINTNYLWKASVRSAMSDYLKNLKEKE